MTQSSITTTRNSPIPEIGGSGPNKSIAWTAETLVEFDAAVVCTAHSDVDYLMLAEHVPLIVDTCNIVPKQMRAQVIAA